MVASGSPAIIDAHEGHHEFVGHVFVVRIFHTLYGVDELAAFASSVDHGVVGLGDAFPAAVAVHGVVAAADAGDLAGLYSLHLLLQLLEIAGAVGRQGVASVHEGVDEDAVTRLACFAIFRSA